MNNILLKSFAALSVSLSLAGCIKETLPQGSTQLKDQVSDSEFAFDGMLNAIPVQMTSAGVVGWFGQNYQIDYGIPAMHLMTENMLEDVASAGEPGYNPFYSFYSNTYMSGDYKYSAYFWTCYYTMIKAANDIIGAGGTEPAENIKPAVGKALAYRAMFYLDLARLFEPKENGLTEIPDNIKNLTVPIITEATTEEQAKNNPRVDRVKMYDEFILKDLERAEAYLSGEGFSYSSPTLGAVYGLMARAYLEKGYWTEGGDKDAFSKAYDYAEKAITASGRTPLTQDEWEDPVNGFNNGSANKSWIWGCSLSSSQTNNLGNYTAMFSSEALWGYPCLYNPSASVSFYNAINDNDFRKHSWLDPCWTGLKKPAAGEPYEYDYKLSGTAETQKIFLQGDQNTMPAIGYQSIKFRPAEGLMLDYTKGSCADHVLMRVEEMWFIQMEALAMQGQVGEAKNLLEKFMNSHRVTTKDYSCPASDLEGFINEMFFQKRVEFWGEGILIYDYKRLDKGINRKYEGTNHIDKNCQFVTERRSPQWNIVIPRNEYQNNPVLAEMNNPDPTQKIPL